MGVVERALLHSYDHGTGQWRKQVVQLVMEDEPFAQGAMRTAYRMTLVDSAGMPEGPPLLAKFYMDPTEGTREAYFRDVRTQHIAKAWALEYSKKNVPKKVDFVEAWVVELVDRPARPVCACERLISGEFQKHNTNVGATLGSGEWAEERNTPQAFSHFTYEASKGTLLVCDIQGVGDMFTDPQIHSVKDEFGKGNFGATGMKAFLNRHYCNAICSSLGLTVTQLKRNDRGTMGPHAMSAAIKEANLQPSTSNPSLHHHHQQQGGYPAGSATPAAPAQTPITGGTAVPLSFNTPSSISAGSMVLAAATRPQSRTPQVQIPKAFPIPYHPTEPKSPVAIAKNSRATNPASPGVDLDRLIDDLDLAD
jgi:hypothetical protein